MPEPPRWASPSRSAWLPAAPTRAATAAPTAADEAAEEQGGFTPPDIPMATELGDNEGALSVLAWPGYAEDGSTDKSVDWVTPFEEETGCQVDVKYFGTSDEAVTLMKSGQYDVVSASGDATLRLIAARRRGPGQHRPDPQLRRRVGLPQGPRRGTPSTARCTASRTATAPTC